MVTSVKMFPAVSLAALAFGAAFPFVAACGGGDASSSAPVTPAASSTAAPTDTAAASASASAAPAATGTVAWKDMSHDQRAEFMAKVVTPKMQTEFAAFDATRYSKIGCKTCHGAGAKDGSFKMPNADLPPVPNDEAGFGALMAKQPQMVKFMMEKVVPDVAQMIGEAPYDPKTKQGFGCHDCHTAGTPSGAGH